MLAIVLREQRSSIFIRCFSFSICSCFHLKYVFCLWSFLHIFIEIIIICFWGIKLSCFRTLLVMGKIMGVGNSSLDFMLAISQLKFGLCMFDLQSSLSKLFVQLILELFYFDFMYWIWLTIFLTLNIISGLILMNFFARVFKLIPSFMSIRFCKHHSPLFM